MENENENIDSIIDELPEQEIVEEPQETETTTKEVKETPEAKLARLDRQAAQLRKKLGVEEPKKINNEASKTYGIEDEVLDLRLEGYSKSDVEFIMRNGGRKALEDKNSLTSIAINQKKQQDRAEDAAGRVTDSSSQSDIEKKYTPEQLRNMSSKELEAILPKAPNQ